MGISSYDKLAIEKNEIGKFVAVTLCSLVLFLAGYTFGKITRSTNDYQIEPDEVYRQMRRMVKVESLQLTIHPGGPLKLHVRTRLKNTSGVIFKIAGVKVADRSTHGYQLNNWHEHDFVIDASSMRDFLIKDNRLRDDRWIVAEAAPEHGLVRITHCYLTSDPE